MVECLLLLDTATETNPVLQQPMCITVDKDKIPVSMVTPTHHHPVSSMMEEEPATTTGGE